MEMQKYLALFVSEAGEHLARMGAELVHLERVARDGEDTRPMVDGLFRHAHSVKGMSASMEQDGIAALSHRAEDLVEAFRGRGLHPDPASVDVLLAAVDALSAMVRAAEAGERPSPDVSLVERLGAAAARAREAQHARTPPQAPAPAPGGLGGAGTQGTDLASGSLSALGALAPGTTGGQPPATGPASPPLVPRPAGAPVPEALGSPAAAAIEAPAIGRDGPAATPGAGPPAQPPRSGPARRLTVEVEVARACPAPPVRGFLVVQRLSRLGRVVASTPSLADLRAGRLPGNRLDVVLETQAARGDVERLLSQVGDLSRTAVTEAREPGPAPERPPPPAAPAEGEARTVRVRVELLDAFLDTVGELILATARLRELGRGVPEELRPPLEEGVDHLAGTVKSLHDQVMAVRMTPLALVVDRLPRVTRDLGRGLGKQVELVVRGADIAVDRTVLDELSDLLIHLVRNAVVHGVEPPHLRLLAGKSATGVLTLQARRDRDRVVIELGDDGRGMDAQELRAAAVARGAITRAAADALPDAEAFSLACLPGVSTAREVTELSGRGVGLDAVKRSVDALGGAFEIASVPGAFTRFTLRLPLTLAVQPVLLAAVGDEVLGLPVAKVRSAALADLSTLGRSQGTPVLPYLDRLVPVHDLAGLLGFPWGATAGQRAVVVADGESGLIGLAVDKLLGQVEAVLKPLARPLDRVAGLSAVTVLASGRPVFVLDVGRLGAA